MKRALLTFAAFTFLFAACKKDDNNGGGGSNSNTQNIITTGQWYFQASTSIVEYPAPLGNQTVDLLSLIPACQRDNIFTFNTNNTVTTDEGPLKCSSSAPQQSTGGSWQLLNGGTQFIVSDGSNTVSGNIVSITTSEMVLSYVTTANGIRSTTTTTYKKK